VPHILFALDVSPPEEARRRFGADVARRLGEIRDNDRGAVLGSCFGIPRDQVYVVLTRPDGPEVQLHHRVLPPWSTSEDPLAPQ
jgi:hypothetical protein